MTSDGEGTALVEIDSNKLMKELEDFLHEPRETGERWRSGTHRCRGTRRLSSARTRSGGFRVDARRPPGLTCQGSCSPSARATRRSLEGARADCAQQMGCRLLWAACPPPTAPGTARTSAARRRRLWSRRRGKAAATVSTKPGLLGSPTSRLVRPSGHSNVVLHTRYIN